MTNTTIKSFTFSDYLKEFEGNFKPIGDSVSSLLLITGLEFSEETLQKIIKEMDYLSTNTVMTNCLNLHKAIRNILGVDLLDLNNYEEFHNLTNYLDYY